MQYNPKISRNGAYLDFYGWSVISMLDNDLKFIENYITNHNILNKYFVNLFYLYLNLCNRHFLLLQVSSSHPIIIINYLSKEL